MTSLNSKNKQRTMSNTAAFDEHVPLVYLDHAAGTPLDPDVLAAMLPYLHEHYANPSSMHGSGRAAARIIADARARIAACIGAHPDEIIFTSGGTESDNLAVPTSSPPPSNIKRCSTARERLKKKGLG